jgi:hypothetical protein
VPALRKPHRIGVLLPDVTIEGCRIGTDAGGTIDRGNGGDGINVSNVARATIGGPSASQRNVISGNTGDGIELDASSASAAVIRGNRIGTNANGTAALGNNVGVWIVSPNNMVGGAAAGAGNLVSGNGTGVYILGTGAVGNRVEGNRIGTNAAGTAALGNGTGVYIESAADNVVGGTVTGAGNLISGNGNGVLLRLRRRHE